MDSDTGTRRRFLQLAGTTAVVGVTGCTGDSESEEPSPTEGDQDEELPEGVSEDEFEHGPVPQEYQTAVSIGGEQRRQDGLQTKADVQFLEYDDALETAAHQPGRCCANCDEFIADKNGDEFGACAVVEGYIDGGDWCTIWEELPEPEVPEGLSEDELATADVPTEYREATSQTGEQRNPDDLLAQENVSFGESVEKIKDGVAQPGMSCANCAEFIPDKNGDGWGACAAVEGYIATEDWCSVWESISEEL
jgi:hypothetical protein